VAAVGRRVLTLCNHAAGLRQQLAVDQVYHNFCLSHAALRMPLPQPAPTNGTGSAKRWRSCTPAMAAGLTDHVWTLREVVVFRVPPWPQPSERGKGEPSMKGVRRRELRVSADRGERSPRLRKAGRSDQNGSIAIIRTLQGHNPHKSFPANALIAE
jgi:hypothetical protein